MSPQTIPSPSRKHLLPGEPKLNAREIRIPERIEMSATARVRLGRRFAYFDDEAVREFYAAPDVVAVYVTNDHALTDEAQPQGASEAARKRNRFPFGADTQNSPVAGRRFLARGRDRHYSSEICDEQFSGV